LDFFGRIGPFQRVTANPNKKIRFSRYSRLRLCKAASNAPSLRHRLWRAAALNLANRKS
jgi:hypothetical protein